MASSDLKEDVAELKQFLDAAKCQRVKDVLSQQLQKWQMQLDEEEKKRAEGAQKEPQMRTQQAAAATVKRSVVKELRQYAWDQSDKFMKLYVDIPGLHKIEDDNITANFETKYLKLSAVVEDITYMLAVGPFHAEVLVKECKYKVKTDKIVIMLKKKEKETWPYMIAKQKKEKSVPPKEDKDPSEGLMDMLKKMYDEGDDTMKRTINESFYKSQTQKGQDPSAGL